MSYFKMGQQGAYTVLKTNASGSGVDVATLSDGSISNTEFGYLNGLSQNIQDSLNAIYAKQDQATSFFEVRCASSASINPLSSTPFSGLPEPVKVGGIALADMQVGDRVLLVKDSGSMSDADNGIWIFNGSLAPMTRPDNYNQWDEFVGSKIYVAEGSSAGRTYVNLNTVTQAGTVNTTPVAYRRVNDYLLSGNSATLNINNSSQTITYVGGLRDQNDVTISAVADANILVYNDSLSKWVNVAMSNEATILADGSVTLTNAAVIAKVITNFNGTVFDSKLSNSNSLKSALDVLGSEHNRVVTTVGGSSSVSAHTRLLVVTVNSTTQQLPDPAGLHNGFTLTVKQLGVTASNVTTISTRGELIDGQATFELTGDGSAVTFITNGANWYVI